MIRHFLNNHPKLKTFAMKRNDVPLLINCFRVVTAPLRPVPFFILIGAHKSASTTLYDMICSHPEITQAYEKEPCYFQFNHKYGQHWYRSRFPICRRSGEASTGYHWFPETPGLVARELPNVKLIAIFRNPVERAYSHYQHWKRGGLETLEFVDAIACERAQPMDAWDWCLSNPSKLLPVTVRAYLSHGCYARQLAAWYRWFDPEQILICRTEDLAEDPQSVMERIWKFLNLDPCQIAQTRLNAFSYKTMDPHLRARLVEYFQPHNRKLYDLLDRDMKWDY